MKDDQRIKALEEELKVLKNEVHAVLLDLREQYLNLQNPFNQNFTPSASSQTIGMPNAGEDEEIEPTAKAGESNTPVNVKAVESQEHLLQLPKLEKEETTSNPKAQAEAVESQIMDMSGIESHRIVPRDDKTFLWPRSEADEEEEEEEDFEEPPPKAAVPFKRRQKEFVAQSGKVDLVVIAGLTQWLDQATAKLGKERTEVLVEISFAMGRLSRNLKDTLIRMIRLSHHESTSGQSINASDYLAILAQLDNLLSGSKQQDNALLSILSMMKDSRNG